MVTVTVYSTGPGCVRCRLTLRKLDETGIPYRVVDLSEDSNAPAHEYLTVDLGYSEAPVVIVDGEPDHHWCGFRPDLIDRLHKWATLSSGAS
ncbi:glutaredoxin family protein [Microbacterium immunditiarum]|uniref:Glutaredoxin-like protein NrdH n=1 Tax=Microbacterium immunditiarum TaxID=337480 RepID=A0A7Y9KI15_9MICO|nr:glutaredoxin family protein [Microbacterium immunditiarum]NYE18111.1 glutaredoxin-like protein NrdH [Microbacterium immunditiarum]